MASRIELRGRYSHRTLTFDSALLSSSKLRPATAPPAAGFSFIRSWWREATRGDYRQELRSDLNEAESTGLSAMPPHASELHDRAQNQISLAASARAESVPSASMADPWTATRYPVQFATLVWFEGLDIGADNSTPVDDQYKVPNKFTGTIAQVVFNTSPMKLTPQQKTEFLQRLDAAGRGIQ